MIKAILTSILSVWAFLLSGQAPIDIADNMLKVPPSGEKIFYYSFSEGDQLIFNFEEVSGKELKEIEIAAVRSSSLFRDYKTRKIENKILHISETGIYKFRFTNSNLVSGRLCKFKIQRVLASTATRKLNPPAIKRFLYDTTYYYVQEKFLIGADTVTTEILNQTVKVLSNLKATGNKTTSSFTLPGNTIAWSYYIGVDQAGQRAYENAARQLTSQSSPILTKLVGATPLTALALGFTSYLSQIQNGEKINYYLEKGENSNLSAAGKPSGSYKKGKVINDFAKMEPIPGNLSFCFFNDNAATPATVILKVTAIQVKGVWETRQVKKMNITPKQEKYLKN